MSTTWFGHWEGFVNEGESLARGREMRAARQRKRRRAPLAAAVHSWRAVGWLVVAAATVCSGATGTEPPREVERSAGEQQAFAVNGIVEEIKSDGRTVVVRHEAIGDYMAAMTMPFRVKEPKELKGLRAGDGVSFRLRVTDSESWIEGVSKAATAPPEENRQRSEAAAAAPQAARPHHPLHDYKFTNELGQAVSLNDFRGQALGITFFFTRCPLPEFCPRLSQNFQEAARRLTSMPGAPTNWHFLSVSFDTEYDTPAVLRAYGAMYKYDPKHWSFVTGPADKIGELARLSDVTFQQDGGTYSHNFRTLIIDAAGHVQMVFPMGGNLSEDIVKEILKAAVAANRTAAQPPRRSKPPAGRPVAMMAGETHEGGDS